MHERPEGDKLGSLRDNAERPERAGYERLEMKNS
jgi:hypothetical protein